MAIEKLIIHNFKGIFDKQEIDIKPITVFIGANSSGKSSCIHALACLSQTIKLPNNYRHLILDDEYAFVHLGRFIDVIHSKNYNDKLTLGINIGKHNLLDFSDMSYHLEGDVIKLDSTISAIKKNIEISGQYCFNCTKRTQEIILKHTIFQAGSDIYDVKRTKDSYDITFGSTTVSGIELKPGLIFDISLINVIQRKAIPLYTLIDVQSKIKEELLNTLYLGPFRQSPLRTYPTRSSIPSEVGPYGEATISMLANEIIQTKSREHIKQIADWLDLMDLAKKIDISRKPNSDLFDVNLTLKDGAKLPIADLGYGLSQILPVLTQCSFSPKNSTLLFEQPELHLHTKSSRKLTSIFIDTYKKKNSHIVLETHSPELIKQLLIDLRDKKIDLSELVIYKVIRESQQTRLSKLNIDDYDYDIYENWEMGISI